MEKQDTGDGRQREPGWRWTRTQGGDVTWSRKKTAALTGVRRGDDERMKAETASARCTFRG
uniref:Uncharacterized protein n=1 Tax=Oryza sativa subsp. japonica TaxID=39947 RepID=Q6EQ85_ORYSJ|nr:hypothetical protein [Oryza sativa Japonica Group]